MWNINVRCSEFENSQINARCNTPSTAGMSPAHQRHFASRRHNTNSNNKIKNQAIYRSVWKIENKKERNFRLKLFTRRQVKREQLSRASARLRFCVNRPSRGNSSPLLLNVSPARNYSITFRERARARVCVCGMSDETVTTTRGRFQRAAG